MTFAVIGTGALGAYYGASLQSAGFPVHFLARSDFQKIKTDGLLVESPKGDMLLREVSVYNKLTDIPPCDVVLLCLKETQNQSVIGQMQPLLAPNGFLAVLENGLKVEAEFVEDVGADRIVGGICFLCSNKVGPGHVKHLDYGNIQFGEYRADGSAGGKTERLAKLSAAFATAGIENAVVDNLAQARWRKLVWNVPFNGLSVVLNRSTSEIMGDAATRKLAETLMQEVVSAAKACGQELEAGVVDLMLQRTAKMIDYDTSMKVDFKRGRPMELDAIYGQVLDAAKQQHLQLPETEKLYQRLLELNSKR